MPILLLLKFSLLVPKNMDVSVLTLMWQNYKKMSCPRCCVVDKSPLLKTIGNWVFLKTFLNFMMIDSKPNLIQYFKIWHRVVDSSQLVMGLMKTRRNLNFEVRRERNFIQILRYLMHLTNLS